jgi:hypothetical protein
VAEIPSFSLMQTLCAAGGLALILVGVWWLRGKASAVSDLLAVSMYGPHRQPNKKAAGA